MGSREEMEVVSSTQFKAHFEAHDIMNTKRMRGREVGREGRHFSIFREHLATFNA